MGKKNIDIQGHGGVKKGDLKGGTAVDVNLGDLHASSSSEASIGKHGYSEHTSQSSSVGHVFGSSQEHSESVTSKGLSSHDRTTQNVFGARTTESKGFHVGGSGLNSTYERSLTVGGVKMEQHSSIDVNKDGVSFGNHANIAGKRVGYSGTIPNPTHAMKHELNELKGGIDLAGSEGARVVAEEAANVANQTANLASRLSVFASSMARGANHMVPKDLDKLAGTAAKLAGDAAHVAVGAAKVANQVAKAVGPVVGEILKAIK